MSETVIEGVFSNGQIRKIWKLYKNYSLDQFASGQPIAPFLAWYFDALKKDEVPAIRDVFQYAKHIGYAAPPRPRAKPISEFKDDDQIIDIWKK